MSWLGTVLLHLENVPHANCSLLNGRFAECSSISRIHHLVWYIPNLRETPPDCPHFWYEFPTSESLPIPSHNKCPHVRVFGDQIPDWTAVSSAHDSGVGSAGSPANVAPSRRSYNCSTPWWSSQIGPCRSVVGRGRHVFCDPAFGRGW